MKSKDEILKIIDSLDRFTADHFEDQDLDFKEWNFKSFEDCVNMIIKYAVCMANGGGGAVVIGVRDKVTGRTKAISGIPENLNLNDLRKTIIKRTDPSIIVELEILGYSDIDKKILLMKVIGQNPPYSQTDGKAHIRIGKECMPLTGTMQKELLLKFCVTDFTANTVAGSWKSHISPIAMEHIRKRLKEDINSVELAGRNDEELLTSIGAVASGKLTIGGLLIAGREESIEKYVPNHAWDFRKMKSSTDYIIKNGGLQAIPTALYEIERHLMADNPSMTVQSGLFHFEYPTYPRIAMREAILNAFLHRDYNSPGSVMLKLYNNYLELSNPGKFIGGITPENILHHPPMTRNNHLATLLDKLSLVNRTNLGVPRIYKSLLEEGKEPPIYHECGDFIILTIMASPLKPEYNSMIKALNNSGICLDVDHLIIVHHLVRHREIDSNTAARICQRSAEKIKETLSSMSNEMKIIEQGGTGKGRYYTLAREIYTLMKSSINYDKDKILDRESVKLKILSILKDRRLTNRDIRQITGYDRQQVIRLMRELEIEGVKIAGRGMGAYYSLNRD